MRAMQVIVGLSVGLAAAVAQARGASVTPPAAVLATIERGPVSARDGMADYANAIKPGAGIALSDGVISTLFASAVGVSTIGGLDPAQPQYLVWVDDGLVHGAVLVGGIADDAMLTQETSGVAIARARGRAVIGARPLVDLVGTWALGALRQPGLGRPNATIYVANVLARYHAQLAAARSQLTVGALLSGGGANAAMQSAISGMASALFDGVLALAADTERVILTIDADAAVAGLDLALVPRAGSRLAKFVAAQQPNDFALLAKLPAGPSAAVAVGALHAGPYRRAFGAAMAALYAGGDAQALVAPTLELMQAMSGEFAAVSRMTPGGLQSVQLVGAPKRALATRAIGHMMTAIATPVSMNMLGLKATLHANPQPLAYDGLAIDSFETAIDLSTMTAVQQAAVTRTMPGGRGVTYTGVVDRFALTVASGSDGDAMVKALIDTVRGRAPALALTPDLRALVAAALARRDSAVMLMDLSAMRGLPVAGAGPMTIMMSAGFADRRAHLRMAMPVASFKAAAGMP